MAVATKATPAIATQELTKRYGSVLAVDHLTIEVELGEIFGFLGPNGAGKTTTMRMLLGLVKPSSGGAQMLGLDTGSQLAQILAKTGAIIENPTFYPFLSGYDNLGVVCRLTGTPDSRIGEVLKVVDLTGDSNRKFKHYSLGMKQRLAVAAALLSKPDLLILDEPGNGLDPAGIVEMRNLMKQLKGEGHTVFISSHVLHEIEQICDRIAIMNHGKVVVQGRVDALLGAQKQIEIVVNPQDRARAVLTAIPWVETVTVREGMLVVGAPVERSAEINQRLAEEGLYASRIAPTEESLERYFLDVTSNGAA